MRGVAVEAEHAGALVAVPAPPRPRRALAGRAGRWLADSRAVSTAYGLRTPSLLALVNSIGDYGRPLSTANDLPERAETVVRAPPKQ